MTATRAPWKSGHCLAGPEWAHGNCRGAYDGHDCRCACHTPPSPGPAPTLDEPPPLTGEGATAESGTGTGPGEGPLDVEVVEDPTWVTPTGLVVTDAEPESDEWLAARRGGITGTDLPKILGLTKYGNALSVWLDKRGEMEDEAGEAAEWGHILEDPVAQKWAAKTGVTVTRVGVLAHVVHPWKRASLDRIVTGRPRRPSRRRQHGPAAVGDLAAVAQTLPPAPAAEPSPVPLLVWRDELGHPHCVSCGYMAAGTRVDAPKCVCGVTP